VAVSPDGARAYVTNFGSGTVSVIDTATNTVTETVAVGRDPSSVAVSPDGARAYVANSRGSTMSVIDTATNTVTGTVTVGVNPSSVAVSPDGARAYVTNYANDTVSVIDTTTNTVTETVTVGFNPSSVAVSPDGARAYVTHYWGSTVSVIDTATNTVTETVDVGYNAISVAVSPDGARAYVTNFGSGTVSVIDTATNTVTETVIVGNYPSSVTVSPSGTSVYVTNQQDGSVSVLREAAATHTVTFDSNGGAGTMTAQSANASTPLTPGTFTREGYAFTGWNTVVGGIGTSYADGADYAFTADATLYAQWAAVEYTISYDLAGGTAGTPANPVNYTIESAPVTLTAPARDGYTFTGWTGTGLTEPTRSATIPTGSTGDQTFTATWEVNPATTLVISGPATVTEQDTNPFTVEAFDAHGVSLGDVTAEVTFAGADVTGADVTFPIDYTFAGQTVTRTLTAMLGSDPSVTGTLDVQVVSAVTGITITAPETVMQGDTITVQVTATGANGPLGDATAYAVITSNVSADVVDGAEVSFPTASPHTLTATLGDLTATHTIDVTPPATVTPTPKPAEPTTPVTPSGLPATGAGLHGGVLATAGLLLALGAALTLTTYRRRHH
ncbi:InlB B-repeat-containing protein, partial [Leucobacter albus]